METRDLLLLIGFLRSGKMFPVAVPQLELPLDRALWVLHDMVIEQERALFPRPRRPLRPRSPKSPRRSAPRVPGEPPPAR